MLDEKDRDRMVSKSPDIKIRSYREPKSIVENEKNNSGLQNISMVSDRFRELSPINEEKGVVKSKSESKTPNISSKIKSNFITKYKNANMENKLTEGLTDSVIGLKSRVSSDINSVKSNFSKFDNNFKKPANVTTAGKMTERNDVNVFPNNSNKSKYMSTVKNVTLGSKMVSGNSTPTYKMKQSFASVVNEREFRVVDSKHVNLSFLLNKDPSLIETDLIKVCKMRK